jgi:hypothetical protein
LLHQARDRGAAWQQLKALYLTQDRFKAFGQDGFITVQKNPRHYSSPLETVCAVRFRQLQIYLYPVLFIPNCRAIYFGCQWYSQ